MSWEAFKLSFLFRRVFFYFHILSIWPSQLSHFPSNNSCAGFQLSILNIVFLKGGSISIWSFGGSTER